MASERTQNILLVRSGPRKRKPTETCVNTPSNLAVGISIVQLRALFESAKRQLGALRDQLSAVGVCHSATSKVSSELWRRSTPILSTARQGEENNASKASQTQQSLLYHQNVTEREWYDS